MTQLTPEHRTAMAEVKSNLLIAAVTSSPIPHTQMRSAWLLSEADPFRAQVHFAALIVSRSKPAANIEAYAGVAEAELELSRLAYPPRTITQSNVRARLVDRILQGTPRADPYRRVVRGLVAWQAEYLDTYFETPDYPPEAFDGTHEPPDPSVRKMNISKIGELLINRPGFPPPAVKELERQRDIFRLPNHPVEDIEFAVAHAGYLLRHILING